MRLYILPSITGRKISEILHDTQICNLNVSRNILNNLNQVIQADKRFIVIDIISLLSVLHCSYQSVLLKLHRYFYSVRMAACCS